MCTNQRFFPSLVSGMLCGCILSSKIRHHYKAFSILILSGFVLGASAGIGISIARKSKTPYLALNTLGFTLLGSTTGLAAFLLYSCCIKEQEQQADTPTFMEDTALLDEASAARQQLRDSLIKLSTTTNSLINTATKTKEESDDAVAASKRTRAEADEVLQNGAELDQRFNQLNLGRMV